MEITDRLLNAAFVNIINKTIKPALTTPHVVQAVHIISNTLKSRSVVNPARVEPQPLSVRGYLCKAQLASYSMDFKLQAQSAVVAQWQEDRLTGSAAGAGSDPPIRSHKVVAFVKSARNPDIELLVKELCRSRVRVVRLDAASQVFKGDNCLQVAAEYGFSHDRKQLAVLTLAAVDGKAGAQVHQGANCRYVAASQGIPCHAGIGFKALMLVAVDGLAGERVRGGEDPAKVAEEHGISKGSRAWKKLQHMAMK